MKLKQLIKDLEVVKIIGNTDVDVKDITQNSNCITVGSLFICLSGRDFDGHDFVSHAENYGAVAVVTERETDTNLTQIIVNNSRIAMSILAGEFYGRADKKLKLVGVVGTNGKTSTTHIIKNLVQGAGIKCGVIGTLGVFYGDNYEESKLTTPDPIDLHKTLAKLLEWGAKIVIMEISAHAIELEKIFGLHFEVAVFTNFSQDHLDFFENMERYMKAKLRFFDEKIKYIVSNSDDEVGLKIINKHKGCISYGIENPSDIFALDVKEDENGSSFVLNLFDCIYEIKLNLMGRFNVYNALAGATASALLGVKTSSIVKNLQQIKQISGRLENVYKNSFSVYVDYAHTPDGLEKSIKALKRICKNRLITVFGCGGNRDQTKRELMGKISGKYSDFTVITSDNPRYEEPMDIILSVEKGLLSESKSYVIVQDRVEAIRYALSMAKTGDIILVAGKGSEKYQEILGIKHLYNDKDTVNEIIRKIVI